MERRGLARLNADGSLDTPFNPLLPSLGLEYGFGAMALQSDGKILVGGEFDPPDQGLLRFNPDGSRDTSFGYPSEPEGNLPVMAIAVQPDDKIVIAGDFDLARLNPDGTRDPTFNSPVSLIFPYPLALQADGTIVGFDSIGIVRVNADGSLDTGFHNEVNWVWAIALQPDGRILIGGSFSRVNGFPVRNVARLNGGPSTLTCGLSTLPCQQSQPPQMILTSPVGAGVAIEVSGDLQTWTWLMTVTNTLGTIRVSDPVANGSSKRFYRARLIE